MQGPGSNDFDALARRYWSAWGDALRTSAAPATPAPGWNEALDWWSQLAKGGHGEADEAVDRFNAQARGWFGQMQQLAAQFAGRDATAADIAGAWKQALGGDAARPLQDMFGAMHGVGIGDPNSWLEQWLPQLQKWQQDGQAWLGLPAFGFAREHQERWQRLARMQLDCQAQVQAYQSLLAEAGQSAFALFERRLDERARIKPIGSARELFDLWIDAAEEAYAEVALSPRFRDAYAELTNAQMKLRGAVQTEIEQGCALLGLPTRTELDSAHRKIAQLERELRRLRESMQSVPAASRPEPQPRAAPPRKAAEKAKAAPAESSAGASRRAAAKKPRTGTGAGRKR